MYMDVYGKNGNIWQQEPNHSPTVNKDWRNGAKYLDDSQVAEQLNQWELIGIENTCSRVVW